ncbi:MAG: helix-turn-helix domain-containing protein [Acidaminococcales bacterium]|jgi:transcriptional regulator with XRE-family HTH domain|nr:helix-turn-helix domain-containing protein [Acidaminococcales bacterium]
MTSNEIFSTRLAALRKERKLSLPALGDILSISSQAVSQFEKGGDMPSFDNLVALADYFNVSLDWLTGRSERRELWVERKK